MKLDTIIALVAGVAIILGLWWIADSWNEGQQAIRDRAVLKAQAERDAEATAAANLEARSLSGIFDNVTTDLQERRNENVNAVAAVRTEIRRAPAATTLATRRVSPDFVRLFNRARGTTDRGSGPADDTGDAAAAGEPRGAAARTERPRR